MAREPAVTGARAVLVLALASLPARAFALCPNCLGQEPTLSPALRLVGLFLLIPPAVFFLVARTIRRLERRAAQSEAPASAPGGGGGDQAGWSSSDLRSASAAGVPRSATSPRT